MAAVREWTGRDVFAVTAAAFAIVIAVNGILAWAAVRSFPGLEVANSYVASQTFDAERTAQLALGWRLDSNYSAGNLHLAFTDAAGRPADVRDLQVLVGRTTEAGDDVNPVFLPGPDGFAAPVALAPGRWMLRVQAKAADGTRFHQRLTLTVRG